MKASEVGQTDTADTADVARMLKDLFHFHLTILLHGGSLLINLRVEGFVVEEVGLGVHEVQTADVTIEQRRSNRSQLGV